eukprot:13038633-Alexandrium_andersonii.AAC.1
MGPGRQERLQLAGDANHQHGKRLREPSPRLGCSSNGTDLAAGKSRVRIWRELLAGCPRCALE